MASTTFEVGSWALGVRSSSAETDGALRRILAAHVLDTEAPPNFSLLMADESGADGRARSFNFLYRSSQSVVRSRAPGRVLRGLLHYLSEFAAPEVATLRLSATAFVAGDRAVVGPYALRYEMDAIQARLNAAGVQVVDTPLVHLDPDTGDVVVHEPALTVDAGALAQYEARNPPAGRELPPVPCGRYPILAWAFVADEEHAGHALGRAEGLAAAAQQVANANDFGAPGTLDAVATAFRDTPAYGLWWRDATELVTQLKAVAKGG